ncbi:hypothetical protein PMI09_00133 [Rhizobium sp. CF122]|nr:hypothetical protein PMI09_00133 [Rhizobium sp. CF122]
MMHLLDAAETFSRFRKKVAKRGEGLVNAGDGAMDELRKTAKDCATRWDFFEPLYPSTARRLAFKQIGDGAGAGSCRNLDAVWHVSASARTNGPDVRAD